MSGGAAGPTFHVGTSGFSYDEWRPAFYPDELKKTAMLAYYAERLPAVELNNTFYRMPSAKMVTTWSSQVPATFRFAIKATQRLTWTQKLKDCGELLGVLWNVLAPLGDRLGCVFYQVPKWVRKDTAVLREFLALQQPGVKVAFEFAHASWFEDDALAALRDHGAALVASDKDGEPEPELRDTATWAYLRLRRAEYTDDDLRRWRDLLRARGLGDVFLFFKHEDSCAGPALARRFLDLLGPVVS
ncbi:MAG: DUF72 domain-containing protein [Planctomycetes bacterium]|nr:DUF72 domain-containing protein [Planctomycetota bacterium]